MCQDASSYARRPDTEPVLAFFGHHKAGSGWICRIIDAVCQALRYSWISVNVPEDFGGDLQELVDAFHPYFLKYWNAQPEYVATLSRYRAFHVTRDPRDMAVSAYFSHRYSHPLDEWPELAEHREKLARLDVEQGLMADLEFTRLLTTRGHDLSPFDAMADWDAEDPDILELKFEDLVADPVTRITEVFRFLGLCADPDEAGVGKLGAEELARIVDANSFTRLTGRRPGQEDPGSHYRKGVPGDWRHHFGLEHKAWFKEKYGEMLERLGYERDENW